MNPFKKQSCIKTQNIKYLELYFEFLTNFHSDLVMWVAEKVDKQTDSVLLCCFHLLVFIVHKKERLMFTEGGTESSSSPANKYLSGLSDHSWVLHYQSSGIDYRLQDQKTEMRKLVWLVLHREQCQWDVQSAFPSFILKKYNFSELGTEQVWRCM